MTRRIDVQVDDVTARFILREDLAPQTTAALWETLPIETHIRHGKLSGDACYFGVTRGPLAALVEQPELPVTSIYKGWIVAFPSPARGQTELLVSYGVAEYRWPTGRRYVTPVAELEGTGDVLFDILRRTQIEGEKRIIIRRVPI